MTNKKLVVMIMLFFLFVKSLACPLTIEDKNSGGQCITVNGTQLYLRVFGKSQPSVIFLSGFGVDTHYWDNVTIKVAQFAKVIVYDRPEMGKSEPCQQCKQLAAKDNMMMLQTLLKKAHLNPPYILVGQSLGGLYAQWFAEKYPSQVTGVVLVDSSGRDETMVITRKENMPGYKEAIAFNETTAQVRTAGKFPCIPLIILTATQHVPSINEQSWQSWQADLKKLSLQSMQIIAWGSSHNMQKDQPDLIVDAIATMVLNASAKVKRNFDTTP